MTLTKQDLEAIGQLIDEKLAPIRTDIHYMKNDIEIIKRDVSNLKFDIAALRHEIEADRCHIKSLQYWRAGIEMRVNAN